MASACCTHKTHNHLIQQLLLSRDSICSSWLRPSTHHTQDRIVGGHTHHPLITHVEQEDGAKDEQDRAYVRALLLACFAAQNRCLLATQSLLETCLQLYRSGFFIDDIQSALSIAGMPADWLGKFG